VIGGVADDVGEGVADAVDHGFVELGLFAAHV